MKNFIVHRNMHVSRGSVVDYYLAIDNLVIPKEGKIAVIVEDNTRPGGGILHIVMKKILYERSINDVTIVTASGAHSTDKDMSRFLSPEYYRIGIGTVTPHTHVEWSGGGKLICPGLLSRSAIKRFHKMNRRDAEVMVRWYEQYLDQVVNFTVNDLGEPVDIEVGIPSVVRRNILPKARKTYEYNVLYEDLFADVVILEPAIKTYDMFQVMNVLNLFSQNENILKESGRLVIKADFENGLGHHGIFDGVRYDVDTKYARLIKRMNIAFITDGKVVHHLLQRFFDSTVSLWSTQNWREVSTIFLEQGKKIVHYTGADIMKGT